jgi:hypothetical protein
VGLWPPTHDGQPPHLSSTTVEDETTLVAKEQEYLQQMNRILSPRGLPPRQTEQQFEIQYHATSYCSCILLGCSLVVLCMDASGSTICCPSLSAIVVAKADDNQERQATVSSKENIRTDES